MASKDMLAIIVPYYKLPFFETTLSSLANQTDKRFKVYIGDDASPEDPRPLLEGFKGQFEFSYHRFDANLGQQSLTKHWERCIALSKSEPWLMVLGDDDILDEKVVEAFYENHNDLEHKTHVIRFASKTLFETTKTQSEIYQHPVWEDAYTSFYRRLKKQTRSSLSEYIFSRSSYETFGFTDYPLGSHADDRAWLDFSDGLPIYTINDAVVSIRVSNLNITGRTDNIEDKQKAQLLFYDFLVRYKLYCFISSQRDAVLLKYEKIIFYQKPLSLKHCLYLLIVYLRKLKIKSILRLLKQMLKTIF